MKRDTTGKFVRNWDTETKQQVCVTLTATAWGLLEEEAQRRGISRSEVIEQFARNLAANPLQPVPEKIAPEKIIPEHIDSENRSAANRTAEDRDNRVWMKTALRRSEEWYRSIVETANEGIWLIDTDAQTLYSNDRMAEMLGYTLTELLERTTLDCCFPEDLLFVSERIRYNLQGIREQFDIRLQHKNGSELLALACTSPVVDRQGNVIGSLGMFTDVTDRKRTEKALRQSEEQLRLAQQAAGAGLWDWNMITNRVTWSAEYYSLYGLDLAITPSYDHWLESIWDEDRDRVDRAVQKAVEQRTNLNVEFRITHSTQGTRWLTAIGQTFCDASGNPFRMTGIALDITARKQVEAEREQLLANARHYANQLQGLTKAALAINSALSVEAVLQVITDEAAAIIGVHQSVTSVTINQNWAQAINAIYLSEKYAQWRAYDAKPTGTGIYAYVCHLNCPMRLTQAELEAHPHWKGFSQEAANHPPVRGWLAAPLVGRDGHNIGLIQLSDKCIGEFTEADESILVQLAQMASVAVENTRLFEAEQQARSTAEASREEAQAANRVKDEFLAVLSHELRSPLNPILGWARLLQTRPFDAQSTQRALETIERNAKLQTQLIDDLLDVSRILRGKMALTVCPVNLSEVIEAALETVQLSAEAKEIDLRFRIAPCAATPEAMEWQNHKPQNSTVETVDSHNGNLQDKALNPLQSTIQDPKFTILGDASRLQQIVWNLLSNAIKFTPAGGQIEIRLERVGSEAQIQVQDTGKGISPAFLPYVFEYFRQEDGTTTRQFGGLGLGLAIVRYLSELHGGTVGADSGGEDRGATFTVRLPLLRTEQAAVGRASNRLPNPNPSPLAGLRILAVDDDADMRSLMLTVLEGAGAETTVVASATQALTALDAFHPHLLVSDVGMPEIDGYMLIRQIRTRPAEQGGKIPAIALTAYAGEINQQQAITAGFQRHLAKPIDPNELITAIQRLWQMT